MGITAHIITKDQYEVSKWSGGTTTQLLIYPEGSNYSERNFKWRLSSAKVELEESKFTHLPGISRVIMVLDGELKLEHEGHHKVTLKHFDQDKFMGDWVTKSIGKVTDFNLMLNKDCSGKLEALKFKGKEKTKILLSEDNGEERQIVDVFYVVSGEFEMTMEEKRFYLNKGELLYITRSDIKKKSNLNVYNRSDVEAEVIRAIILYFQ